MSAETTTRKPPYGGRDTHACHEFHGKTFDETRGVPPHCTDVDPETGVCGMCGSDTSKPLPEADLDALRAVAWAQGRESIATDMTRPLNADGTRPATPNPYLREAPRD